MLARFSPAWPVWLLGTVLAVLAAPVHAGELEQQIERAAAPEYRFAAAGGCSRGGPEDRRGIDLRTRQRAAARTGVGHQALFLRAALAVLGAEHRFETPVIGAATWSRASWRATWCCWPRQTRPWADEPTRPASWAFRNQDHTYANWLPTGGQLTETDPLAGLKELARQIGGRAGLTCARCTWAA